MASVDSLKSYLLQHDHHFVYSTVDNKEDCALGSSSLVIEKLPPHQQSDPPPNS